MNAGIYNSRVHESPSLAIADAFRARVLADNGIFEGYDHLVSTIKTLREKDIYDKASIILTPNGYKNGKLYSLKSSQGDTDFMSSGGGGSRVNIDGNIVPLASGMPKIDYTSGTPEIVMERAATNILRHSETLSSQTVTTNTQSYILSFYGTGIVTINESTPVVLAGTGENERVFVIFSSTGGSRNIVVNGMVKYGQLESIGRVQFYSFPSSWIPTNSIASIRPISSLMKENLSNLISQTEGSIYFEARRQGRGSLLRLDDGTNNNTIRFFNTGYLGNNIESVIVRHGIQSSSSSSAIPLESKIRIALRYNSTSCDIYINGSFYVSLNNPGTFSNHLSRISFTSSESTINHFKCLAYIPNFITSAELITLSSF